MVHNKSYSIKYLKQMVSVNNNHWAFNENGILGKYFLGVDVGFAFSEYVDLKNSNEMLKGLMVKWK